jgi:hypothetical protein
MRRKILLGSTLLLPCLLTACAGSGFWAYVKDTETLPGQNPNRPKGSSETYEHVRHVPKSDPPPLLTEAGDVWPGPPQPVPTLRDLQKQQTAEFNGTATNGETLPAGTTLGLAPLPPLPALPGYEISPPEPYKAPPPSAFPGGRVRTPSGLNMPATGGQDYHANQPLPGTGSIIVPNGNGTSTVIGPNGTVTTIPTPK